MVERGRERDKSEVERARKRGKGGDGARMKERKKIQCCHLDAMGRAEFVVFWRVEWRVVGWRLCLTMCIM